MNMELTTQQLKQLIDHYVSELDQYTMEQLTLQPDADSWSLGQMYNHLIRTALHMQLEHAANCITRYEQDQQTPEMHVVHRNHSNADHSILFSSTESNPADRMAAPASSKSRLGELIFEMGAFPEERIQVPGSAMYTPVQPADKQGIQEGLRQVYKRMCELAPLVTDVPEKYTAPHPRFGDLTAAEWLKLIEMHYRHHLHQKRRLDEFLNVHGSLISEQI